MNRCALVVFFSFAFSMANSCSSPESSSPGPSPTPEEQGYTFVSSTACDSCAGDCAEDLFEATERTHTEAAIDYGDLPPTCGVHHPCWLPWGSHETEQPDERFVHNLEHGGVDDLLP